MLSDSYPACQLISDAGLNAHLSNCLSRARTRVAKLSIPKYAPSTWVTLRRPITAYSFDEAWLLCEGDPGYWIAWVPDYGEILLSVDEFY